MNLARFGLRRQPFAPQPDVRAYVPLATHEAAVAGVTRAFTAGGGLALVDGGAGSGKSLTALRFASDMPASRPCVVVPAAKFARPTDLLQTILFDLGADYRGLSETELRLAVTDRLLASLPDGPTVIILDEAQHLSDDALEEVRLIGNLNGRGGPAAFVVLVAQPSLRARLGTAGLADVAERLAVRCRLDPLDRDESVRFVRDRLAAAGGRDDLIDDEAAGVLADHGKGSPRLLNRAAATAFTLADEAEAAAVDVETVLEAVGRLGLADETKGRPAVLRLKPAVAKAQTRKRKSA